MIRYVKGIVLFQTSRFIELDIGKLAFGIYVPNSNSFSRDAQVELYISWQWNNEQGPMLYGFQTCLERDVFELVIGCSGVGAKLGLALLDTLGAPRLVDTLIAGNSKTLSTVSGVGNRKAELMIAQLQPKAIQFAKNTTYTSNAQSSTAVFGQAQEVLESLGYTRQEIQLTFQYLQKEADVQESNFDAVVRKSLIFLAKKI